MCFGRVIVTLLALPWLNGAAATWFNNNNSVLVLYNAPPQRLMRMLEQMGRQTDISNCKATERSNCIATNQCSDVATIVFNRNATCSWLVYEQNMSYDSLPSRPTNLKVWGFGLVSVGVISLSGLFGGLFWPLINSNLYNHMMHILISLAVGSLSATSLFQLIPEGFNMKASNQDYLETSVFIWSSLWILYMLQILSKILFHQQNKDVKKKDTSLESQADGLLSAAPDTVCSTPEKPVIKSAARSSEMTAIAYMIIFGDALHNFIDGMSIGAGYSQDLSSGLGLSIAVACEEFPHELGDFAILINSGMPLKKALLYNFLSACTAFGGLALGIVMGELKTSVYIFAFAGGLFLYISLADLMPELNRMVEEELQHSKMSALFVVALQNIGTLAGVATLYFVAKNPILI